MNDTFADALRKSRALQEKWLQSERTWSQPLEGRWVGRKVLGVGSYGIAGLWEYVGSNTQHVRKIVVKQTAPQAGVPRNLATEGKILEMYAKSGSKHILRQYGTYHMDMWNRGAVMRLFLEYCPGGDLYNLANSTLEEGDLWAIFNCLAKGVLVMHSGGEDVRGGWSKSTELVHFDLHMSNVLLGCRDRGDHQRMPAAKIADFGEALEVPKDKRQQEEHYMRGNYDVAAPENEYLGRRVSRPPISNSIKGTHTNIWQIGFLVYQLLLGSKSEDTSPEARHITATPKIARGYTHGHRLYTDKGASRYSRTLRDLIMECMMREPVLRPRSRELVTRTEAGFAATRRTGVQKGEKIGNLRLDLVPFEHEQGPTAYPATWDRRQGDGKGPMPKNGRALVGGNAPPVPAARQAPPPPPPLRVQIRVQPPQACAPPPPPPRAPTPPRRVAAPTPSRVRPRTPPPRVAGPTPSRVRPRKNRGPPPAAPIIIDRPARRQAGIRSDVAADLEILKNLRIRDHHHDDYRGRRDRDRERNRNRQSAGVRFEFPSPDINDPRARGQGRDGGMNSLAANMERIFLGDKTSRRRDGGGGGRVRDRARTEVVDRARVDPREPAGRTANPRAGRTADPRAGRGGAPDPIAGSHQPREPHRRRRRHRRHHSQRDYDRVERTERRNDGMFIAFGPGGNMKVVNPIPGHRGHGGRRSSKCIVQ